MNIRDPRQYDKVRAERRARHRFKKIRRGLYLLVVVLLLMSLLTYGAYARPLPKVDGRALTPATTAEQVALSWPAQGQAAIGVTGQGVMAQTASQQPVPTASVTKLMLALAVLKKYPLQTGQTGPNIPITAADVDIYNKYISQDGSVVKVVPGQPLSQYQALQAVLIPSGNNMADTLAIWAYGSMAEYHLAANQIAKSLGMSQSTFAGDAGGLLPETVSTAHDIVLLGQAALANPVIKEIVAQKSAEIPVSGLITNTNYLLGQAGIIGIKTGNTDQAGGCFVFAAERSLSDGQKVTTVGAILGAPSRGQAINNALPLLDSFYRGFTSTTVVAKGTVVGRYDLPWGGQVQAVTAQDTIVMNWRGSKANLKVNVNQLKIPQVAGAEAGTVTAQTPYGQVSVPVVLSQPFVEPTWQWRVTRR
ncbi:MAG: hypothetical protein QG553_639 [Patescibacteria group bacterium]|nr:hypothetical protein [Patescibacteria group bacterium]